MSFPKRVHDALNYNEQKVQHGVAQCLHAAGYLRRADDLSFTQKLEGLQLRNSLNERALSKTLHVSLNFSPRDRTLDGETLKSIARDYMKGIGFEGQPYLVYCHHDAGHPHLHIVSTIIRSDGSRIPTHNLGREQSSRIRLELEAAYGLVPARGRTLAEIPTPLRAPEAARYGGEETRRAIARVVSYVFRQYHFSSLPEYNAALSHFGVVADRGREGSRTHRHGGLVYRILDEGGRKTGVPIKASLLPGKPTLINLEQRFASGAASKQPALPLTRGRIDAALHNAATMEGFRELLAQKSISMVIRKNEADRIYGLTYVDHKTRTVFNGSELGKSYGAAAVEQRLAQNAAPGENVGHASSPKHTRSLGQLPLFPDRTQTKTITGAGISRASAGTPDSPPPPALIKSRKRKRRKPHNP